MQARALGLALGLPYGTQPGGGGGSNPNWAWRASDISLAPYVGTGTPACTRAGTDAMAMNSSFLLAGVAANTARFDYYRCITPDTSGYKRHAFSMGAGLPPSIVGGALPGLSFDGLDANEGTQGLNAGVSGFGVSTADGSMKVKATIRRSRTGALEAIIAKSRDDLATTNWGLYIDATGKLSFGVVNSAGAVVTAVGTTSLAAGTNYDVEGEWTGTALNVKVNGVQEGTTPTLTALQAPDTTTPLTIGRYSFNNAIGTNPYPFQGVIANVQMYRGGVLQGSWAMLTLTPTLLVEPTAINRALHNRDLTNAAWVKGATMTAAKNQTGVDGSANGASSLTGGAVLATNTALQAIVLASSSRVQSTWVRRLVGTGTIEMTTDGGTSWVAITARITTAWNRIDIPAQTVTNPSVGFRITTNTDSIAVDYVQNETDVLTSQIATGAAAVTRNIEDINVLMSAIGGSRNNPAAIWVQAISGPGGASGINPVPMATGTDAGNYVTPYKVGASGDFRAAVAVASATQADFSIGTDTGPAVSKVMLAYDTNDVAGVKDGGTVGTDVVATIPAQSRLLLGNNIVGQEATVWRGWLVEAELYNTRPANGVIQSKTA